jgi:hypothetical protein
MKKTFCKWLFLTSLLIGGLVMNPGQTNADSITEKPKSEDTLTRSEAAKATANARTSEGDAEVEMADIFRQEGKIYVVVGIAGAVLLGFFLYLFSIERRLAKMEDKYGR